jgi:hypothetical protein
MGGGSHSDGRRSLLSFWRRLLITLGVIVLSSFVAGLLWNWVFGAGIPSYLGGIVGGLTALPTWEFLKRVRFSS